MNKDMVKGSVKILAAVFAVVTGWVLLNEGRKNIQQAKTTFHINY